jgi:hypothetical protein
LDIHEQGTMAYASTITLKAGFKYTIWVSATQTKQVDLETLEKSQRQCILSDETESQLYSRYSQRNCLIQCKIEEAASKCDCVPWEFTAFAATFNASICGATGQACFRKAVRKGYCEEKCPIPCTTNSYTFSLAAEQIQTYSECQNINEEEEGMPIDMPLWTPLLRPDKLDLMDFWTSVDGSTTFPCVDIMQNTSIVEVRPATERVTTITQRPRRTFADQLAAFGKFYFTYLL